MKDKKQAEQANEEVIELTLDQIDDATGGDGSAFSDVPRVHEHKYKKEEKDNL